MTEETVTREEYNKLLTRVEELQKALKARDDADSKREREAADRRVDAAEDKLEKAAREAGVSVATLKAAAEAEEQAAFDRRMDSWAERHGVEVNSDGESVQESEGESEDESEGEGESEESGESEGETGKPKTLKKPRKTAVKPEKPDEPPDKPHWSERPIFRRKAAE